MFRSTTIIRELVLNLVNVIYMLKHSVKLRRYMLFGDMAACHRVACVLCAVFCTAHNPVIKFLHPRCTCVAGSGGTVLASSPASGYRLPATGNIVGALYHSL
jgi:hypothetical protein